MRKGGAWLIGEGSTVCDAWLTGHMSQPPRKAFTKGKKHFINAF